MKNTPLIGYPTITVRNKDTGEVIKTMTVKNTTSMLAESVFSVESEYPVIRDNYSFPLLHHLPQKQTLFRPVKLSIVIVMPHEKF